MGNKDLCTSVFKSGRLNCEIYTAVWVTLINCISSNQRVSFPKEEAHE